MSEAPAQRVLRLSDGRALAYREWGDLAGSPVVFVHGSPGSSVWSPDPHQDATRAAAVRLIAVDRPGFGGSDVLPGLTFGGWAADVAELADGLGLERFAMVGLSGGGPWAAACAALIPERLAAVGIASSRALAEYNVREPTSGGRVQRGRSRRVRTRARPRPRRGGETPHSRLRGVDTRAA